MDRDVKQQFVEHGNLSRGSTAVEGLQQGVESLTHGGDVAQFTQLLNLLVAVGVRIVVCLDFQHSSIIDTHAGTDLNGVVGMVDEFEGWYLIVVSLLGFGGESSAPLAALQRDVFTAVGRLQGYPSRHHRLSIHAATGF